MISTRISKAQRAVGVPYTDDMIANASKDAYGQAAPDSPLAEGVTKRYGEATNVRAFDGKPGELTEMDALVAYLQVLGHLTDAAHKSVANASEMIMDLEHDLVWLVLQVVRTCSI